MRNLALGILLLKRTFINEILVPVCVDEWECSVGFARGSVCVCALGLAQSLAACVLQFHSLPSVSSAASISDQDPEYIFILIFIA